MAQQDNRTTNQGRAYNETVTAAQVGGRSNVSSGGVTGGGYGPGVPTAGKGPSSSAILRPVAINFPIIGQINLVAGQESQFTQRIKQFGDNAGMPGELILCFPASATPWTLNWRNITIRGLKKISLITEEGAAATVTFAAAAALFRVMKDSQLELCIGNGVTVNYTGTTAEASGLASLRNPTRSSFNLQLAEDAVLNVVSPAGARTGVVSINSAVPGVDAMHSLVGNGCDGDGEIFFSGAGDISHAVSNAAVLADAQNVNCCYWNGVPIRVAGPGATPHIIRFTNIGQVQTSAADRPINVTAAIVNNLANSGSQPVNLEAVEIGSFDQSIVSAAALTSTTTYDKAGSIKHSISGGGSLTVTDSQVNVTGGKQSTGSLHEVGAVVVDDASVGGSSYCCVINEGTAAFTQNTANPRAAIGTYEADGVANTITQTPPGTLVIGSVLAPAGPTAGGAPVIGQTVVG